MKPMVRVLDNGMTVVLRPSAEAPVVAFQVWIGVGSTDEGPGEEGLAHVLEHMLFKGTKRRAVGEIARDVERAGGQINAWTSFDETVYYVTLASRFQDQGLDILADAVQHAALDGEELARELMVIREEIRMGEDSPEQVLVKDLFGRVFRRHPYKRPVIGFDKTVRGFTRKKVVDFYRRWYIPGNIVFSIAGDFEPERMLRQVQAAFGGFSSRGAAPRGARPAEPLQKQPRFSLSVRPVGEAHLALAFPIPGLTHEDVPALDLLAAVLGQGMSSRLEGKIRREQGLVTDIRAMAYTPRDLGVFAVFANCGEHQIQRAHVAIVKELADLVKRPVSSDELKKAKVMIESESIYTEETVDGLARKSAFYLMHAGDVDFEQKYVAAIGGLSAGDLMSTARRYFAGPRATVSVVSPDPARRRARAKVAWIRGRGTSRTIDKEVLRDKLVSSLSGLERGAFRAVPVAVVPKPTVKVVTLSSGDRLIVRRDPSSHIVAARAAYMGGLRLEPRKQAGLFSLMAGMLVRGTSTASAGEVARRMDRLACSISGFSGRNTFGVHGEFLSSNYAQGFSLMADCLRRPSFPDREVAREKQLLLEDILESRDNPSKQAFLLFYETMYGSHPYSRLSFGTEESVGGLDANVLRRGLRATAVPGEMVMAVVGGVEADEVVALAETYLAPETAPGRRWRDPGAVRSLRGPRQATRDLPKEQSHLIVGFPGTTITAADRFAVEVLVEMLGGHGGRLFEQVREIHGLAYSVTAISMEGIDPGYVVLYAGTAPGGEAAVVAAMTREVERICRHRPPSREVQRVKRHLIGSRAIAWQRTATRAASMSLDELYGNGFDAAEHYAEAIDGVRGDDVVEAARRHLDLSRRVVVCVGPGATDLNLL